MKQVVIVGASLAGTRAAEVLRSEGYEGALTLVGDEDGPPYDRPPLSKQVLAGEWEAAQATIPVATDDLDVDWKDPEGNVEGFRVAYD